jgi:hypothetical protein
MRDFRDAKAMAHTLRVALAAKEFKITISQSLELIAKVFGTADWNTLAAAIRAQTSDGDRKDESPPPALRESDPTPGLSAELGSAGAFGQSAYERFVGKWIGDWGGTLASSLAIENVADSGEFYGVYSWGTNQYVSAPGTTRIMGRVTGEILAWGDPIGGIGFRFRMPPNGTLQGERWDHGVDTGTVVMTKT